MAASASAAVLPTPKPAARPERPKSAEPDSGPFLARVGSSAMLDEDNPFGDETFRDEAFGDDDGFGGAAFDGAADASPPEGGAAPVTDGGGFGFSDDLFVGGFGDDDGFGESFEA